MFKHIRTTRTRASRKSWGGGGGNYRRLNLEALDSRDVPATFYVTSGADSGPGSLREALNTMDQNVPNQIFIEVEEIGIESQLFAYDSAEVQIIGDLTVPSEIHPVAGMQWQFRGLVSGIADSGVTTLHHLVFDHFAAVGAGADADGGAILNLGFKLNIDDCSFSMNQAAGNGGAIASTPGLQLNISSSLITENQAGGYGGGIYYAPNGGDESLSITHTDVTYNTASLGGGLYSVTNGTTYILGGYWTENTAVEGAAIYMVGGIQQIDMNGDPTLNNITFNFSTGSEALGAVYCDEGASVWIEGNIAGNIGSQYDVFVDAPSLEGIHVCITGFTNVPNCP